MQHLDDARRLHADLIGVDAHHDILMDVLEQHKQGKRGILSAEWAPRLRAGGVRVQVLPVYIEERYLPGQGLREALRMVEAAYADVEHDDSALELAADMTGIQAIISRDKVAGVLALEGCDALDGDAGLLPLFYRLGVRMVGLTWEHRNAFADGTGERNPGGLTRAGRAAVAAMAAHRVILDVSHLAEPGFWEALELAEGPVVASHSNARAVLDHPRNLTDAQIKALAQTDGVMGLNGVGFYVDAEKPTLDRLVDHIAHVADLIGVEHVGIGADLLEGRLREMAKGAVVALNIDPALLDFWVPEWQQAEDMPYLSAAMLARGFSEADVRAVMGGNFMRVFKQVWG